MPHECLASGVLLPGYPEKRPFPGVSKRVRVALSRQGCALPAILHSLGAPLLWDRARTVADVDARILGFRRAHERNPTAKDLSAENAWLRRVHASSISLRCRQLDLPGYFTGHTNDSVVQTIHGFWEKAGRTPKIKDLPSEEYWLSAQGSSLRRKCSELGLPVERRTQHTQESVDDTIIRLYRELGRPPTRRHMNAERTWLRKQGSSLSRRCQELSLLGRLT